MRRFARCDKGISSVEFVIILPVLMLFLFSIITFGSILYIHANMENAAREAVRRLAVDDSFTCSNTDRNGPADCTTAAMTCSPDPWPGTAEGYACNYLAGWVIGFAVEVKLADDDCIDSEVTVTVELPDASVAAVADVFGFFDGSTLSAEVSMREEACIPTS